MLEGGRNSVMLNRDEIRKRYSIWSNLKKALSDIKIIGYVYYAYLVLDIITQILVPFLLILIPAEVIRLLQSRMELSELLLDVSLWIGSILSLNLVRTYVHQEYDKMGLMLTDVQYWRRLEKKVLSCEITQFEDEKERERLWEVLGSLNQGDGMNHYSGVRVFMYMEVRLL